VEQVSEQDDHALADGDFVEFWDDGGEVHLQQPRSYRVLRCQGKDPAPEVEGLCRPKTHIAADSSRIVRALRNRHRTVPQALLQSRVCLL